MLEMAFQEEIESIREKSFCLRKYYFGMIIWHQRGFFYDWMLKSHAA